MAISTGVKFGYPTRPRSSRRWTGGPSRGRTDSTSRRSWHGLISALRRAVEEELTERQRRVFVAIALNGVPLDALVVEMGSSRTAIYKTMFDARRKLRAALAANGYLTKTGPLPANRSAARLCGVGPR